MKSKVKRIFSFFISLCIIVTFFNTWAFAEEDKSKGKDSSEGINVEARSAILMEANSGKIVFEKNSHEKFAPASVTKIMTMLLTMEAVDGGKINLNDKVTVSENAKKMGGSTMLLDTGEIRTVEELIKGIAIASGNDAAVAMAEYIAGSEDAFVNLMNEKAKSLGMKDTNFKNCTGLNGEGHLTTAYDISIMSRELLKHPSILKYTGTYMETISEGRKTPIALVNHNKLVRFFKGCDGLKTGFTEEAKYCISATAVRDGVRMLTVIMGAPTYKVRNRDASMLMNHGFSKFQNMNIVTKDAEIEKIFVDKHKEKYFIAKAREDLSITIEKGKDQEVTKKIIIDNQKNQYRKDETVGYCEFYSGNQLIGKIELYSDRDIRKPGVFENMKTNFKNLFKGSV